MVPLEELTILSTALITVFSALWFWRRTRRKDFELVGHVSSLIVYPLKSCAGVYLDEAECTALGIKYDRKWVILREADESFVSQRQEASLALVKPYFQDGFLWLGAPGMSTNLKLDPKLESGETKVIDIFGTKGEGIFAGVEAAHWISEYLNKPGMMIYFMASGLKPRQLGDVQIMRHLTRPTDQTAFSDVSSYMVLSEASLTDLNTRMDQPKSIKTFRPNIVVTGCEAFSEDNWKLMQIGDVFFTGIMKCTRCVLTGVDPETGTTDKTYQALKTLRRFRLQSDRKLYGHSPVLVSTMESTRQESFESVMQFMLSNEHKDIFDAS